MITKSAPKVALRNRQAFSLIEVIVVIAVILVLVAVSVPAFQALMRSGAVTTGAQGLIDELNAARQTATSKNVGVEIRFYEMKQPPATTPEYRAYMTLERKSDGTLTPLGPLRRLPGGLIFYNSVTHSTLLGSADTDLAPNDPFKNPEEATATKVFSFRSDGSTNLDAAQPWFVTLIEEKNVPATPPPGKLENNWAVIRVDPVNGRASVYRP